MLTEPMPHDAPTARGCGASSPAGPSMRLTISPPAVSTSSRERCALHPERLAELGAVPGQQARIITRSGTALFTLTESSCHSACEDIQLSPAGLRRLGRCAGGVADIDLSAVRSGMTYHAAKVANEFIETLSDTGRHRNVIAIAPHGGDIEKYTDRQAERVYKHLGPNRASTWNCRGWHAGGGAFTKWHISSTDISEHSFPLLGQVTRRNFRHAVAFHGCRNEEVLIGGRSDHTLQQELQEAISRALTGTGIPVRLIAPGDRYSGSAPNNLINRLAHGGDGIQLEQGPTARRNHWAAIADSVAEVYGRHDTSRCTNHDASNAVPPSQTRQGNDVSARTPR